MAPGTKSADSGNALTLWLGRRLSALHPAAMPENGTVTSCNSTMTPARTIGALRRQPERCSATSAMGTTNASERSATVSNSIHAV